MTIGTSFIKPGGWAGDVLHAKANVTAMGMIPMTFLRFPPPHLELFPTQGELLHIPV